jgi:hypothetical protein
MRPSAHPLSRVAVVAAISLLGLAANGSSPAQPGPDGPWATDFDLRPEDLSSTGSNPYFTLVPGSYSFLEGGRETLKLTVLNETKLVAGVETRVIEEYETRDGKLAEISRNYYAIHKTTNDVYYFGEDVAVYKNGKVKNKEGSWEAGRKGAKAGLMMPGEPRLGYKHYQEQAPGTAMDRAEIVSTTETIKTPAGTFENCLKVAESSPMAFGPREYKYYAPGIGMIKYEKQMLSDYGNAAGSRKAKKTTG